MTSPRVNTLQFRCLACGHTISLTGEPPPCPMCQRGSWQRLPITANAHEEAAAVNGTMLWFDEAKDYGFIRTEHGERLYVDRDGFVERAAPVGRCAGLPVRLTVSEQDGGRSAVDVSLVPDEPHGRARRRRSSITV